MGCEREASKGGGQSEGRVCRLEEGSEGLRVVAGVCHLGEGLRVGGVG